MPDRLFGVGFPVDRPSVQEIDSIGTRLAQSHGVQSATASKIASAASAITDKAGMVADGAVEALLGPASEIVGAATQHSQIGYGTLQTSAINALQSPLRSAAALGYVSQGTPIYGLPAKKGRKKAAGSARSIGGTGVGFPIGQSPIGPMPPSPVSPPPPPASPPPTGCSYPPYYGGALPVGGTPLSPMPNGAQSWNASFISNVIVQEQQTDPYWHQPFTIFGAKPSDANYASNLWYLIPSAFADQVSGVTQYASVANSVAAAQWFAALPGYSETTGFPTVYMVICGSPPPSPGSPPAPPPPPSGGSTCVSICNWPSGLGAPPPSPGSPPPPPPPPAGGQTCASPLYVSLVPPTVCTQQTCSIAWLSANQPLYVIAQRQAAKTDFDILTDAISQGLCGDPGGLKMPACSLPMLEREFPAFVQTGQSQGLTDRQIMQSAIDIGLCSAPEAGEKLAGEHVTEIAPESAEELEYEYDPPPPTPGLAPPPPPQIPITTDETDFCWQVWAIPGPADLDIPTLTQGADCLVGWDRVLWSILQVIAVGIQSSADCKDGSFTQVIGLASNHMYNLNTWWSRPLYYAARALSWMNRELAVNLVQVENWINAVTGCGAGEGAPAIIAACIMGAVDKWLFEIPAPLRRASENVMGMLCPAELPTGPEANALHATNFISKDQWECIQRRRGNMLTYQHDIVRAQQRRPSDDELLLLRRKLSYIVDTDPSLLTEEQVAKKPAATEELKRIDKLFEHNGWTHKDWYDDWLRAQQWVPSPGDAINWMLKDTQDAQIQSTFLLSAEFQQKYKGHVREVMDWQGIRTEDAMELWKAHWRNMSPHVLYELHKRLRPGWTETMSDTEIAELVTAICPAMSPTVTADVLAARPISNGFPVPTYCEELTNIGTQRAWAESLVTTGYHVSEALGQDDYPPFWRQRLLAVSYKVVTRVDARRAYETNQIGQKRLQAIFQDQGYSPGDSQTIAEFYRIAAIQLHSRRPASNQWVRVGYDTKLLKEALVKQGMRQDMFDEVLAILQSRRNVLIQTECIEAGRKRFVRGLASEDGTRTYLNGLGLPFDRVNDLLNEWICLKRSQTRQESANEICKEFKSGIIDGNTARRLLVDLGYTHKAATRILSLCFLSPTTPRGIKHMPPVGSKEYQAMQDALNG